jgi:serine protease inhibitor
MSKRIDRYSDKNNNMQIIDRDDEDRNIKKGYGSKNHKDNIDRIIMERGTFNIDSHIDNEHDILKNDSRRNNKRSGEITGEELYSKNAFDKGMPIRSQYNIKKSMHDENVNVNVNKHLDFSIYNSDLEREFNINYHDPVGNKGVYSDLKISMQTMSMQTKTKIICGKGIENIGFFLLENMLQVMTSSFIISGYGIYSIFGGLYTASKGTTEIELKNYFNYPNKDILYDGLLEIQDNINDSSNFMKHYNMIIFNSDITYNNKYLQFLETITDSKPVNISKAVYESNIINNYTNKKIGKNMRTIVLPDNLKNMDVILLNTAYLSPTWNTSFDGIKIGLFNNLIKQKYMQSTAKKFMYFKNSTTALLELISIDNKIGVGFLLTNDTLDENNTHHWINNLKITLLDEVLIPTFKLTTKIRYTNILKKTDLLTIFRDLNVPNMFTDECSISDVIQNIEFTVTNKCINERERNTTFRSNKKFILDKPFVFYVRHIKSNTILFTGAYHG